MIVFLASFAWGQTAADFRPIPNLLPAPEPVVVSHELGGARLPEPVAFADGSTVASVSEGPGEFVWTEPRGPLRRLLRRANGTVEAEALSLELHPKRCRRRRLETWTRETLQPWLRAVSDASSPAPR